MLSANRPASAVLSSRLIVALIFAVFFCISFLTNILGPLIPDIIHDFHVSLATAAILPFCFFIAYGVMSVPSGFLVELWGEKRLMIIAFLVGTMGALGFAIFPTYQVATVSLFAIGAGMAALQVAINPLLRVAGGPEHFAFNSAFAQLIFGSASFVSPLVYAYLVSHVGHTNPGDSSLLALLTQLTPSQLPWVSIYWLFAASTALLALVMLMVRLPVVERTAEEAAGSLAMYLTLLKSRTAWLYFMAIFVYVGSEQGTADWISEFLARYHHLDPHVDGAAAVAYFWGLLTAGCLAGMLLLKFVDSRRVLIGFSLGALAALTVALFGSARMAVYAFPCVGLFASIMWPVIASLGLNSVPRHHGAFAGILCTGIMGGAIVPLIIGQLGDRWGLRTGMLVLYVTFGCILSIGFWARPLVSNALLGAKPADLPLHAS